MRRLHFYIMGLIALLFGAVSMAEYVLVSYGLRLGWLSSYSDAQIAWLQAVPNWVHGVWAAQATLALVGALCLLAHLRASVWMLAFSFFALVVLAVWAIFVAEPSMMDLVIGAGVPWTSTALTLLLSLLIYLYARQERQVGEVL